MSKRVGIDGNIGGQCILLCFILRYSRSTFQQQWDGLLTGRFCTVEGVDVASLEIGGLEAGSESVAYSREVAQGAICYWYACLLLPTLLEVA